jgi:hypothetical protein
VLKLNVCEARPPEEVLPHEPDDRKANTTGHLLAVRKHEGDMFLFSLDNNPFKRAPGDPGVFTPVVNQ